MRVAMFTPYGTFSQESGVMYLLANYMRPYCVDLMQLTCTGVFSLCDRDATRDWKRGLDSCLECMADQRTLVKWSGMRTESLSRFLTPDEVQETKHWVVRLAKQDLLNAKLNAYEFGELWRGSFERRFEVDTPDLENEEHLHFLKRLALSTLRMQMAAKRFLSQVRPDICLVASGGDFISGSFLHQAESSSSSVIVFSWDSGSRYVRIIRPHDQHVFPCEILLDSIANMRTDIGTWPDELKMMLDEILDFLGISERQVQLPIAQ